MRFVAGRGAAAKSHREDAAGWGRRDRAAAGRGATAERLAGALCAKSYREDAAGCGHRDRAIAGWGVAAELHREATSRRTAGGALNNHGRCNI